jgi:hypothetical protein
MPPYFYPFLALSLFLLDLRPMLYVAAALALIAVGLVAGCEPLRQVPMLYCYDPEWNCHQ